MHYAPVDLDAYLDGNKKRYVTYADAARYYEMPYWTLVNMAKEAGATWALRKTAMVDLDIFEKYLEEHEIHPDGYPELQIGKRGKESMVKRKSIEELEEKTKVDKKKYVRYEEGAAMYSVGLHTFQQLARDAGAIRKVKRVVLVNTEVLDAFIESFSEEDEY